MIFDIVDCSNFRIATAALQIINWKLCVQSLLSSISTIHHITAWVFLCQNHK